MLKDKIRSKTSLVPIFGFMAASFLLMIILGVITYLNYNREGELMNRHYYHEGMTIISTIEASTQIGLSELQWEKEHIQKLFQNSAKNPDIEYLKLIDHQGRVLISENISIEMKQIENFEQPTVSNPILTEIIKDIDDNNILQVTKEYQSSSLFNSMIDNSIDSINISNRQYIVVGLNMEEFHEARLEDVRRALMSFGILLILGSGTFYFLLLIQNYISVRSTLQTMETYTQNVVESMPNSLISITNGGYIETFNRNAAKLLNIKSSSIKGKLVTDILPKCDIQRILNQASDILEEPMECHRPTGEIIPVSLTASRLYGTKNEIIGMVLILRDLREIKLLEKKIERSEHLASLGRMAAGIAHEIRNPLSSIKGFTQYFRRSFKPNSQNWEYAKLVENEVDRLNRVIQELLNFAKPENINIQPTDINPILSHALSLIQSDLNNKNIKVRFNIIKENSLIALADKDMLTQVFLNLFLNALEAMENKGILTISALESDKEINIIIQDSGSGIANEKLSKIFEPFYTTRKSGIGLGLAIVYRLIEQMQAEIKVQSDLNKGTTFKVNLKKWENRHETI
jgi:two-component system sensor histidine kinase HydH